MDFPCRRIIDLNWKSIRMEMFITYNFLRLLARSFNQPKFCPNASWNPNATTFGNGSVIGHWPHALFIDTDNTVFVVRHDNGDILIWRNGSSNPSMTIITNGSSSTSMFVTSYEQIFVDNGDKNKRVDRWTSNGTRLSSPMSICSSCSGIFIDTNNNLHCCQQKLHRVIKKPLKDQSRIFSIVAGTGCSGPASSQLDHPFGIFVTVNFDLYVADSANDRVQLFRSGEAGAITVAGNGAPGTIGLNWPSGVFVDANGYLFILDHANHRILGSGPYGFRCLVGCSGSAGAASDQLFKPVTMSFDSNGNLFVTDWNNNRIQKFLLSDHSCGT